jgi:hypothetical protein
VELAGEPPPLELLRLDDAAKRVALVASLLGGHPPIIAGGAGASR